MTDSPTPCFVPAPLVRVRRDGWTADRQRRFIAALAQSGDVAKAARAVGMSAQSAYNLRRRPGAEGFATAWNDALAQASDQALARAVERSVHGVTLGRFYRGRFIGTLHRYDDRDLIKALTLSRWSPGG